MAVLHANSEAYGHEIMARRDLYKYSEEKVAQDSTAENLGYGIISSIGPDWAIPVGFAAKSVKVGYGLVTKAKKLSLLVGENAVVGMASASGTLAMQKAGGVADEVTYGNTNLYAGLFSGGLVMVGKTLGGGYSSIKTASALTTDPKNFLALSGELTADALGGTQARTWYNRIMPDFLKSDVMITAEADNPFITLVSGRIDSPSVAVVSRETGKPVPLGTTGQDYKLKFNGRQNMFRSKLKKNQVESTFSNEADFNTEVGKTVRARANKQEQLIYDELNDHIEFTKSEAKLAAKQDREDFMKTWEVDPETLPEGVEAKYQKRTKPEIEAYDAAAKEKLDEDILKAVEAKKKELYEANQLEFEHVDPKVVEAAKDADLYYQGILEEGHRLGVKELEHIQPGRHYMTRIFDFQKIREMDQVDLEAKILVALEGHTANKGATREALTKESRDIASKLKDLDYSKEFADYSFLVPKEIGGNAYLNSRKFKFNEEAIQDILVTNIEDVIGQYSYSQQGHFAAMHSFPELKGIPKGEQADVFRDVYIDPIRKSGKITNKESKQLKALEYVSRLNRYI